MQKQIKVKSVFTLYHEYYAKKKHLKSSFLCRCIVVQQKHKAAKRRSYREASEILKRNSFSLVNLRNNKKYNSQRNLKTKNKNVRLIYKLFEYVSKASLEWKAKIGASSGFVFLIKPEYIIYNL